MERMSWRRCHAMRDLGSGSRAAAMVAGSRGLGPAAPVGASREGGLGVGMASSRMDPGARSPVWGCAWSCCCFCWS